MNALVCSGLMLAVSSLGGGPGSDVKSAAEELGEELKPTAVRIADRVKLNGAAAVSIGKMTIPPTFVGASPEVVRQALHYSLTKYGGISVKARTTLQVTGDIVPRPNTRLHSCDMKLMFRVIDCAKAEVLGEEIPFVTDTHHLILMICGENGELDKHDDSKRDRATAFIIAPRYDDTLPLPPAPIVSNTRVSKGDYGMEVLVNGEPCQLRQEHGTAVALLNKGDEYAVRLINDTGSDAAVELLIDGLNMFHFSELRKAGPGNAPRYSHLLIAGGGEVVIPGWHSDNKNSNKFEITGFPESALQQVLDRGGLVPEKEKLQGNITARFCEAWHPDKKPIAYDPVFTGIGVRVEQNYREVKRHFGPVADVLIIRYREG